MSNDFKRIVGKRISAARKAQGLTQEQLAEAIDKTVETVSNIERGVKLCGLATLEDIRKVLNVKLSELIDV
jgi:transcriptional regulator with XRE-family HTH domain